MYSLSGITIAEGVAAGVARVIVSRAEGVTLFENDPKPTTLDPAYELNRYLKASASFAEKLRHALSGPAPDTVRDLFGAVSAFLTDPENTRQISKRIHAGESAPNACRGVFLERLSAFTHAEDPELKAQGRELTALAREFIATLNQSADSAPLMPALKEPAIIVASDLTPAGFLCLRTDMVSAVVLEGGLSSGHLGTVLRELRIPSIFSVVGATDIKDGEHVLVDANNGTVIVEPPTDTAEEILKCQSFSDHEEDDDTELNVTLAPSIGARRELELNTALSRHGIGLLRSEFLFLGSPREPDEEEMVATFRQLFDKVPGGAPLAARTFDFAGDKKPVFQVLEDDAGPLKGYGAHVNTRLLCKELRALLRAAPERSLSVVFPLISRISEARALTGLLSDCAEELDAKGLPRADFKSVFMIETPAAVLSARAFASLSSMFLIGTSSLDEYASAPRLPGDAFTPALAKMIAMACKGASEAQVPVGIAGRYAQRPELLPFFLKLGVGYFTVDSYSLQKLRQSVEALDLKAGPRFDENFYQRVMELATGREIASLINNLNFNG